MDLGSFLKRAAAEPFAYGEWDCAMTIANWVWERTGEDPAAGLRGSYSDQLGWEAIVQREGGLNALVGLLAFSAGLKRTDEPRPGDVGVVFVPTVGEVAAIKTGRGWTMKTAAGISAGPARCIAAWGF